MYEVEQKADRVRAILVIFMVVGVTIQRFHPFGYVRVQTTDRQLMYKTRAFAKHDKSLFNLTYDLLHLMSLRWYKVTF